MSDQMMRSVPLSIMDMARIWPGDAPLDPLQRSVRLAQAGDRLGYRRVWFSEHHNMSTNGSSATVVWIQHIASQTERIRVGSGGVMLPNHTPLIVAEQFAMLATMFPDRIDLGVGRAPGTDPLTMRALRRDGSEADRYPQDILEVDGYLRGSSRISGVGITPTVPGGVPITILGSSLYGAQLAAQFGASYAFASHFAPQALHQAARVYRENFDPEGPLARPDARPHFLATVHAVADEDGDAAREEYDRARRHWLRTVLSRQAGQLSEAELDAAADTPQGQQILAMLSLAFVGTPDEVTAGMSAFSEEIRADELLITTTCTSEEAQLRTIELIAPR